MAEPADKSDDLIAELAKMMATAPAPRPVPVIAPPPEAANAIPTPPPAPIPVRIPGGAPQAAAPAAAPISLPETRGPLTGAIRIPGMDQPPPVTTSAPVSKFDFGRLAAPEIKQEPLSSFTERLQQGGRNLANDPAPQNPQPPATIRLPSDLKPVSESSSFQAGPSLSFAPVPVQPPRPAPSAGDFTFDFGFGKSAEQAASTATTRPAAPLAPAAPEPPLAAPPPMTDPIADLIRAEMDSLPADAAPATVAQIVPVMRTPVTPQQPRPAAPSLAPRPSGNAPIPLKPVNAAPRQADNDSFSVAPGTGLGMRAPANQPLNRPSFRAPEPAPMDFGNNDPMAEIENLIGEAVRVELTPGPVRLQSASQQMVEPRVELEPEAEVEEEIHSAPPPVVPPLTTQFAPRRSSLKDDASSGAEEAILAAAAATGARVDRIEPAVGDDSPYRRVKVKPQRNSFLSNSARQAVGMAVAGTLLLAAGLGLYWVLNMGRSANVTGAGAPQLTADATPVKEAPKVQPKAETDAAKSPVLQKMGGASQPSSAEQLVSTDQTQAAPVTIDMAAPAEDVSEGGLANRKVRTVTVRPDGTIVSGDDAVAGIEALPVERPNVPSVPSTETTNLLGDDAATIATADTATTPAALAPVDTGAASTAADLVADAAPAAVIDPTIVAPTPMNFPVRSTTQTLAFSTPAAPRNTSVNAVVGAQTPNGQIDLLNGGTAAAPTPKPKADIAAPASTATAAAYVQISSTPSEADANSQLKTATARYGSAFGGARLVVQAANLGAKGTWYRVRLPAASLSDANRICAQIKAQGGDCIATNG